MRLDTCFLGLLAVSHAAAMGRCGTADPSDEQRRVARELQARETEARSSGRYLANRAGIEVDVYFHVIAENETLEGGNMTVESLRRQLDVLNNAYIPHKISFKLRGADSVVMPSWSTNCLEFSTKQNLRKGTYADLNVYFFPKLGCIDGNRVLWYEKFFGYSAFPWQLAAGDGNEVMDGVLVRSDTVPGSDSEKNLGMTLIHEVGHWFGLLHTFTGGCYIDPYNVQDGDGVDDTPAEDYSTATGSFGCDRKRDSCPGGGLDPVDNYMDYSTDDCYTHFTLGQEIRMYSQWSEYRAPYKRS